MSNAPGDADPGVVPPSAEEIGQSAKQSVGTRGGSVGTPSQSAFAAVPPGALDGSVNLTVRVETPAGVPLQGNLLTNVYNFGPDNTQFQKSVILTVAVATPPGRNQQAMLAYLDANQTWQALLDSSYNPGTGAVTATTTHFTPFTVVAYGTDGGGCATQRDPDGFCNKWQLICNRHDNVCGPSSYTIGGQVTGLSGALTLSDNVGDVVVLTEDGNFTFPGSYDVGDGFVVSILSAPQNQNCTFAAGTASGMVVDAPITGISVTCVSLAPPTYPIGGVVHGLGAGERITLTQGSQSVTLSANGDFVFPEELAQNSNYSVSVAQSPAGKTCVVAQNATGTVAGVTLDIDVQCTAVAPGATGIGGVVQGLASGTMVVLENLDDPNDVVAVAGNGNFIVATAIAPGDDFNVVVSLQPTGQTCVVSNGAGQAGVDAFWGVTVVCARSAAFVTGQSAAVVVGEPDFISSNALGAATAALVSAPQGAALVAPNGALYLPDTGLFRALVFAQVPESNGAAATGVMGQVEATASVPLTPATALASSGHFAGFGGEADTLLVADPFDNRVLVFAARLPVGNANADCVIGQARPTRSTNAASCGAAGLNAPSGVSVAGGKVAVADTGNHRVLLYNAVPTADGVAADMVLGQPDFDTCAPPAGVSASTLNAPRGVWSDGNRLLVADTGANRVLVWLSYPTSAAQPADAVIGQAAFDTDAAIASAAGTMLPSGVTSDGVRIWTSSTGFHRVEQWLFPTAAGAGFTATAVLGQSDFAGVTANACNCSTPSASSLHAPGGVAMAGTTLVVTDTGNNRFLIFVGG